MLRYLRRMHSYKFKRNDNVKTDSTGKQPADE